MACRLDEKVAWLPRTITAGPAAWPRAGPTGVSPGTRAQTLPPGAVALHLPCHAAQQTACLSLAWSYSAWPVPCYADAGGWSGRTAGRSGPARFPLLAGPLAAVSPRGVIAVFAMQRPTSLRGQRRPTAADSGVGDEQDHDVGHDALADDAGGADHLGRSTDPGSPVFVVHRLVMLLFLGTDVGCYRDF